jgi:enoyl-CoA hydratase/carnithine racemase
MEATPTVDVRRSDPGIAVVTLNRPDRRNAMTSQMADELRVTADGLRVDPSVRAVVLTASGDAFCAGYDLDGVPAYGPTGPSNEWAALIDGASRAVRAWLALPQPVIAAIGGVAADGGLTLTLAADLRLVAFDACFEPGFARLGVPGADVGAAWLLPRIVGRGIAADLMLTARPVDAREAMIIGLASRAVAPERLLAEAVELAGVIAGYPTLGVMSVKRSLRGSPSAPLGGPGAGGPSAGQPAPEAPPAESPGQSPGSGPNRSPLGAWSGGAYATSKRR